VIERAVSEFPNASQRLVLPEETLRARRLWADLDLAIRALVVLLENALAMSPEDQPVEVGVRTAGVDLEITVADRGPGVPDDKTEAIFEAFTQTDSSTTRRHEGLGIGLYLAQRIVRAHNGRIGIEARPDGGSVFVLSFPAFADADEE
ncbi:MAG: sensor histidine kinase, partial [Actinomycetota bacterium]